MVVHYKDMKKVNSTSRGIIQDDDQGEAFDQDFDQFEDEIEDEIDEVEKSKKQVFLIKYRPNYVGSTDVNLLMICMILAISILIISDSITNFMFFLVNSEGNKFGNTIVIYLCIVALFYSKIDIEKID
jgi:hypothetical protein